MKKVLLCLIAAATVWSVQAQRTINDPNVEVRDISGSFHAIKVSNAIDVYLTQSGSEAVAVSASEEKYRDRIKVEVEDGVLKIWFDNDNWKMWNTGNKKLKAYVSFRELDKITASGACDVLVEGTLKTNSLTINISGASDFKGAVDANTLVFDQSGASDASVTGRASSLKIETSGASDFKGYDLQTENCQAKASGASDIKITVTKELNARATGASSIQYRGSAVIRDMHSSGASSINKRGG